MYLCVCKAVSERTVIRAIRDDGVVSLRQLSQRYGIGTCCGKCIPAAREILARESGHHGTVSELRPRVQPATPNAAAVA